MFRKLIPFCVYLTALACWQLIGSKFPAALYLLPPPLTVIKALAANAPLFAAAAAVTLGEALAGLLISLLLAVPAAFLFDRFQTLRQIFYPPLVVWQSVPLIAMAPLMVLWFGFGVSSKIAMVVSVSLFPLIVGLYEAVNAADRDYVNLLKSYGAGNAAVFRLVKLPTALIGFFSGLKIAASYIVGAAVTGEWMGGRAGLGVVLLQSRKGYQYDRMFASVLAIALLSLIFYQMVIHLQKIIEKKLHYGRNACKSS
jgi:ABC-type nitrate/sulfonate/bicarbonate transport system permease component